MFAMLLMLKKHGEQFMIYLGACIILELFYLQFLLSAFPFHQSTMDLLYILLTIHQTILLELWPTMVVMRSSLLWVFVQERVL